MNKKLRWIAIGIFFIITFTLSFPGMVSAVEDEVTVVGVVNDSYQIVLEDGTVLEVADTDMGNDMLNHVGKTVEATGQIAEEEGVKVITVTSYTVL